MKDLHAAHEKRGQDRNPGRRTVAEDLCSSENKEKTKGEKGRELEFNSEQKSYEVTGRRA